MAASAKTPYELLEVHKKANEYELRVAYRKHIHALIDGKISDEEFRCICRAYETLSDYDKRQLYDTTKQWISALPIRNYTLQQLSAEPNLLHELKQRLRNATLREINAQDSLTGHTALYCAARVGSVPIVSYLTDQGAEPDISQRTGSTALHVAAFYGHADVVRCLLESGANYCKRNQYDHTPEQEALRSRIVSVFVELKQNPFVQAAANQLDWFNDKETWENHIDEQYYTQRQTLLHCACKKGHFELVRWLVERRSANLDIVDRNQNSALHLAAYGGHESIVDYLLNRGVDSSIINKWGMTAEQEGNIHGNKIVQCFQNMRKRNMFEMARNGIDWWFQYHFGNLSPDSVDSKGISLLFYACRYGRISVAKWLLDKGADVNIQLKAEPHSTPLHTACLHGHLEIVELLLAYGADVRIKNDYGDTIYYEIKTNAIKQLLRQHETNIHNNKLIAVHIYADDVNSSIPVAKVQLHCETTFDDLLEALPASLRQDRIYFSIARRPLYFTNQTTTVISAVCCARYGNTKFIDIPLRLTIHKVSSHTKRKDALLRVDPSFDFCEFNKQLHSQSQMKSIELNVPLTRRQTICTGSLKLDFSSSCTDKNLTIEVRTIFSPDNRTYGLPGCICLFKTDIPHSTNELKEMPFVSLSNEPDARLYTLALPSPYWFTYDTRQTRLPMIGGIHAFIRYIDIIPKLLSLPADMYLAASFKQPLISRQNPIDCTCLQLRKHNRAVFPNIGYHGTNIDVVRSILMDGLVIPGTVVASGKRISPPPSHIPRGSSAFGISDFADAIFLSSSVYYSSDTAYATPFETDNNIVQVVLECSVKNNGYSVHPCTVSTYYAHPGDDLQAIEWRVKDPTQIEINSVLFIPKTKSKKAIKLARMVKLGMDPSILD